MAEPSLHPTAVTPSARASSGLPQTSLQRGGDGERRGGKILIRSGVTVRFFIMPFESTCDSRNSTIGTNGRFEGESNNAKPPARTDFPVIEDGNNKTKDRFLPSRNYLFIAAKATRNSRQTFHYFPPTVWKYGERKSCHDFFFSLSLSLVLPEATLFSPSVNK